MQFAYETVSKSWATKFLSTVDDSQVMAVRPSQSRGSRFCIGEFSVHNRSGGNAAVGIGGRISPSLWSFGVWDESEYAASSVNIDETADAQSATTGDVNLDTVGTNSDGFVIGCDVPFNLVSLNLSQASSAGTVWQMYYSVATAGTGFSSNFTELTNTYVAPSFGSTGERIIWFEAPNDWHRVLPATSIVNVHGRRSTQVLGYTAPSQYLLVVKSTTAPNSTRGVMSFANLGRIFMSMNDVPDGGTLTNIGNIELQLPPQCDAICAAISVANIQNRCDVKYRYSG